jgi:hypothetical protein
MQSASVATEASTNNADSNDDKMNDGHLPIACEEAYNRCLVCRLDFNTERKARRQDDTITETDKQSQKCITNGLVMCSKCRITAHPVILKEPRKIHGMEGFKGLTCF